jgi:hypothetical protein
MKKLFLLLFLPLLAFGDGVSNPGGAASIGSVSAGGGGSGTPGGSSTQVQFNDTGAFAADSTFTFNKTTKNLASTTYNGNTFTAGSFTLTGAAAKTLTFSNTLTLAGTDASTLNIGAGGTLGTAAFTPTPTGTGVPYTVVGVQQGAALPITNNAIVAYLSNQYGNDSTAVLGNPFLSFKTPLAAYNAVNASSIAAGSIFILDTPGTNEGSYFQMDLPNTGWNEFIYICGWGSGAYGSANDGPTTLGNQYQLRLNFANTSTTTHVINIRGAAVWFVEKTVGTGMTGPVSITVIGDANSALDFQTDFKSVDASANAISLINFAYAAVQIGTTSSGKMPTILLQDINNIGQLSCGSSNVGNFIAINNCGIGAAGDLSSKTNGGVVVLNNCWAVKTATGAISFGDLTNTNVQYFYFLNCNFSDPNTGQNGWYPLIYGNGNGVFFLNCVNTAFDDSASGGNNIYSLKGCPNLLLAGPMAAGSTIATGTSYTKVAGGTAYTLTGSYGTVTFGTTSPSVTLTEVGTYLITATLQTSYVGATYATASSVNYKLRRTNNTAADLSGSIFGDQIPVMTTLATNGPTVTLTALYNTLKTTDTIGIQGTVTATPSAGSVTVSAASISAIKIN